jgi:hypothetical protein
MPRNRKLTSVLIVLASFGVLAWGFSSGCRLNPETGETEVHWPSVGVELRLAAADLTDAASIADPDLGDILIDIAALADQVGFALAEGQPNPDVLEMIDSLLVTVEAAWEAVSGDQAPADVRVAVLLLRSTLRRVRAYG